MKSVNQQTGLRVNFRTRILGSTALVALSAAGMIASSAAFGQAQTSADQAPAAKQSAPIQEVVITGTHVTRNGYTAPTPVTVIGADQLQTSATNNLADYVNTMPAFAGSLTPTSAYHMSSNGLAGLNTLNLRGLGTSRTLVLIDGQRSVGSTTTGLVDINNIPQDLVKRVDVVTGGASAVYGSDAISGVVNFVLDDTFEGTKAGVSGGITTYGDDANWKVDFTQGVGFDNERGHLIVSGDISDDYGIRGVPRAWNNTGQAIIVNPAYTATNGLPQLIRVSHASLYTATWGGIITNTALANTAFGPGGTPYTFHLGSIVSNPYTVGGDWASNQANTIQSLTPALYNKRIFARASYDVTNDINVFGQFSWAGSHSVSYNEPNFYFGNLTVQADNAFIPATISSQLGALGISQFKMGTLNGDLPDWGSDAYRTTSRFVVGAKGNLNAFGSGWSWNAYFQRGNTISRFKAFGVSNRARYMLAIDAVRDPTTGAIVCRSSLADPTNGCVPFNLFGTGVNSQAAINYIEPYAPNQRLSLVEDVWSGQMNGEPFSDWAGPVSVAAGVVHRRESVKSGADDPLSLSGSWFAANYAPIKGSYSVTEGSLETVVPIVRDQFWAKSLDLNAAARFTDYSTSGFVTTWKVGATWDVTSDIRIRATRSRDIRAPNLSELFQTGAGGTGQILDDFHGGASVLYRIVRSGNLNLKPEKADSTGVGVVVHPSFLPGFSASVDYWKININDAIGTIGSQQLFDLCYEGHSQLCSFITPNPATLSASPSSFTVVNSPINLASQKASGIDIEASYHFDLDDIVSSWPGTVEVRYLGTRSIKNVTDNKVSPPIDAVGSSIPRWRHHIAATYSNIPFSFTLIGRIISSGALSPTYVVCSTNCPASTLDHQTVNNDYQPGAFYLDTSMSYDLMSSGDTDIQFYLNIQNLFNSDPPIVPFPQNGIVPYFSLQTNGFATALYDVLGRTFRFGVRLKM